MKHRIEMMPLKSLNEMVVKKTVNPDPISQRPAVAGEMSKAVGIIDSLLTGYSIGTITLRDIIDDDNNKEVYPLNDYLTIDGGHRLRAIRDYLQNRFAVNGRFFNELSEDEKLALENTIIVISIYVCTDKQATEIFRRLNATTPVNRIEMIMANDVSKAAKCIRSAVKSYHEYNHNIIHPIFDISKKNAESVKPVYWLGEINPRRKWDELVGVCLVKAIGKGNVEAGLEAIEHLVETHEGEIPDAQKNVVMRALDDLLEVVKTQSGKKLSVDIFAAFQAVWFALYERNKKFKITNYAEFSNQFFKAHADLTGNIAHKFDTEVRSFATGARNTTKQKTDIVRKFARTAIKNFANPAEQIAVANLYLDLMSLEECVLFRDAKRSLDKKQKEEMLANQGFRCYIDGEPLSINDAVFGHDTAWSEGGTVAEGKVIRKSHNTKMGTMSIEQYRQSLKNKNAA